MALFDSSKSKFLVTDSGGTANRDLSTFITEISGLPGARNDKWSLRRYRHDRPRGRPWPSQDAHGGGGLFVWAKR